ncbi:N-alpha-acetyltransferase 40 [Phytophthora pseudosyringae]|uniref:N-alpha-acetyltransferase 40 n=1 Tax=Phytophthora pseudosyringae TaxID=221518 RepID=A0A8T1VCH7_9STRA|nr:N-alpha-acetyltransferase 40 [Phytophthora pseudosyringae]
MGSPRRSTTGYRRATLGPQLLLKKNTFQGLVIPVAPLQQQHDVTAIVSEALAKQPRLRKFQEFPRASRIRRKVSSASAVDLVEERDDNTLIGVGDRLLYLLQRWQVTNVVLVVAHHDSSLSGRLLGGAELYKLATEAAKLVLEQHYLDSVAEATKTSAELSAAEATIASTLEQNHERLQQVIPATCVMSSDTVLTWPKHHQPTSDGGGRKGIKQGRINHFRHREMAAAERNQEAERAEASSNEGITSALSPKSSGSLEWLGISREEWRKLRSIRVPVKELHYLFMCLVVLLETPIEQRDARKSKPTSKQHEQFVPSDFSWTHCRQVLHKSSEWSQRLRAVRGSTLAPSQATALRAIFQEPTLTENAFVRIAGGAGTKIFAWLQKLLDEYDERDLGLLRIEMLPDTTPQATASLGSVEAKDDDGEQQQQNHDDEHEQAQEKASPILRALQNVTKSPKSPSRKPFKIVDPGRLFGKHHTNK